MRALISVTDKSNIDYFAKNLEELGYEIVSTGGTLKVLKESNVEAIDISEVTNFPEILDGRVKTLSPKIHGGILYKRGNKSHEETIKEQNIEAIDIVVVNLYDFEGALLSNDPEKIIENIDIGGPTLIRSSAKNFKDVLIVTDPSDYEEIIKRLKNNEIDYDFREYLAAEAFSLTAFYDSLISRYFAKKTNTLQDKFTIGLKKVSSLRYGENPSQKANLYDDTFVNSYLSNIEILHGKEMSFNNYNDLNTAIELTSELGKNAVVAFKHATPCGVGIDNNIYDAYMKAFNADPLSIFGGIVGVNGVVDKETAKEMNEIFLEVVAASDFTDEALEILTKKKNIRLLKVDFDLEKSNMDLKYLNGKVLIQDRDTVEDGYEVVTDKSPSENQIDDLKFAMIVCKYAKSNAIVIAKDLQTLGIGGGQTSRIWALESIKNNQKDRDFSGSVLASDAFFPFDDCVTLAGEMNVESIIQPGGSIKDKDSIDKCNELGISMVFTGQRHFRH